MGRILAVDYGTKRVGVAVTDPLKIIANGLTTIETGKIREFIREYLKKEETDCLVVGYPKQMNNELSEAARHIDPFIRWFRKEFPDVKVELFDERFTSKIAQKSMIEGGLKKKARRNKSLVDRISAVLILQSYLEYTRYVRL